uniref:Uncharacterized protein n=1 Tax=Leptobrachium leishanense TaxID=445787 RepID=A0A8C5QPF5_9ANUR
MADAKVKNIPGTVNEDRLPCFYKNIGVGAKTGKQVLAKSRLYNVKGYNISINFGRNESKYLTVLHNRIKTNEGHTSTETFDGVPPSYNRRKKMVASSLLEIGCLTRVEKKQLVMKTTRQAEQDRRKQNIPAYTCVLRARLQI